MSQPWWSSMIQWTLWGLLMSLVMGWMAKSRIKTRPGADSRYLVHPLSTLIVGLVVLFFFTSIAVISNVYANKTTTWWTTTIFVGFALLSLPIIADYFFARHQVSAAGLDYGRMIGSRGNLKWTELRRVTYSHTMKWFRLESKTGDVARISAMHTGLPEFARLLLAHTSHDVIDPDALPILEATAAGAPPPVW